VKPLRNFAYAAFKSLQKIAEHINELPFAENNIAVVEVNGKKICIGKYSDKLFAFAYKCPHAGGLLGYGHIDAQGNVVCPLHRYKYDISNGRNVTGEGYYLRHWSVIEKADGVYVDMEPSKGLFGW
jgi:nitrite reductase/ring-hydroxylating ferredoxin subunit